MADTSTPGTGTTSHEALCFGVQSPSKHSPSDAMSGGRGWGQEETAGRRAAGGGARAGGSAGRRCVPRRRRRCNAGYALPREMLISGTRTLSRVNCRSPQNAPSSWQEASGRVRRCGCRGRSRPGSGRVLGCPWMSLIAPNRRSVRSSVQSSVQSNVQSSVHPTVQSSVRRPPHRPTVRPSNRPRAPLSGVVVSQPRGVLQPCGRRRLARRLRRPET